MVEPIFDYQFRLILIGDSTVGKSSLLKYFTDGRFAEVISSSFHFSLFFRFPSPVLCLLLVHSTPKKLFQSTIKTMLFAYQVTELSSPRISYLLGITKREERNNSMEKSETVASSCDT